MSGANLLSWFALGIIAGAASALAVPLIGMTLAFLLVLVGLLAALLAHAVAEDHHDRGAVVRVAAAYLMAAAAATVAGLWWMAIILAAGGVTTGLQAERWARAHAQASTGAQSV